MKAVTFIAHNESGFQEPLGPSPAAGKFVVQLKFSGICHMDYEVLEGNCDITGFPLVPGHEYLGFVCDVGIGVRSLHLASGLLIPISSMTLSSVWNECASFSGKTQALLILSGIMFWSHLEKQLVCAERRWS